MKVRSTRPKPCDGWGSERCEGNLQRKAMRRLRRSRGWREWASHVRRRKPEVRCTSRNWSKMRTKEVDVRRIRRRFHRRYIHSAGPCRSLINPEKVEGSTHHRMMGREKISTPIGDHKSDRGNVLCSKPFLHISHSLHEFANHLIPTLSPTFTGELTVCSPIATMSPTPSCPPTRGMLDGTGQSPLAA